MLRGMETDQTQPGMSGPHPTIAQLREPDGRQRQPAHRGVLDVPLGRRGGR